MNEVYEFDAMRARLRAALKERNISMRKASLDAGQGVGYVNSILVEGKEPTISRLAAVCDAIGVSLIYILYGLEVSPETELIMKRLEDHPDKRSGILALLGS